MAKCAYLDTCPFFQDQLDDMPALARVFKEQYCRDDFENCARYMLKSTLGPELMPTNMWPNKIDEAKELIARHRRGQFKST